ncbi:MFS transporter [Pseudomonas sp. UL073]|uniref:MFS transporter n=1 Tax=Zestomonas insulae TaxID=2809017 RepID=A0ABS2IGC5_9GAMM|nr:MFS transporter [Pseudomonas insulae]MBM7062124.1 MFS transporter [Pseudomonas insulae]
MDALLILGGLLLILTGLVWLVMLAFGTSLLWGMGSLLPPVTLVYALRHWRVARKAVVLSAFGFIPLVVGLTLLASHDSQRLEAIVSLAWLKPEVQKPAELQIALHGELNGQPFAPQQGELIDGVLSLREGQDFFARREISIRLPQSLNGALTVDVLPQDAGPQPEVLVSWLLPDHDLPEARRLNRGYTLHLKLEPAAPNKLVGDFHLVLPPQYKTALSGKVELFSNRLRYQNGAVDTTFDSRDTLEYVIGDYLQRRFATRAVELHSLPPVSLPAERVDLQVSARINGKDQQLPVLLQKGKRGWRVSGDSFPALGQATAAASKSAVAPEAPRGAVTAARPLDRRQRFSLDRLQSNPSRYQNLTMRVQTVRGAQAEGRFNGIDTDGQIVIRRNMSGAGEASFALAPEEISRIELLEP